MADDASGDAGGRADGDDHAAEEAGRGPDDLSIPMWVWTLLGFTLVTAVVIIVIIWGGAKKTDLVDEDPLMMDEAGQTMPADTQPATTQAADEI